MTWKQILAKERRRDPRDTWAAAMRRKFEKVVREMQTAIRETVALRQAILRRAAETEASYRRKIREGTRRGLERARKRGVKLGGARPRKKINLNELRRLRARGFSQQQLAERFRCSQALISLKLKGKPKKPKRGGNK